MDRDTRKQAQLACQISLGLMAGIFSVIPTAAASPVHDTSSSLNTGAAVTKSGTTTTVAGKQENNVVAWKDFSVAKGETVHFNGSTADARDYNYLNIVTGANTSHIAGTVEGGKNVYIVNQHGVIIDKDATVNVGNLYVSTKPVNDAMKTAFTSGKEASAVLSAATDAAVSDVVNLGTIQAANVQVEGKNIRFLNSANVKTTDGAVNTAVTLNAASGGYVHVGNRTGEDANYSSSGTIDYYQLVGDETALQDINKAPTGNYMLSQNIDASKDASGNAVSSFTPISGFSGKFDGMFYEVRNLKISTSGNAGLFASTKGGARIENLGVTGANVSTSGSKKCYAGAIVGDAVNTTIQNVYSETLTGSDGTVIGGVSGTIAGGLVGRLGLGSTVKSSYNASPVTLKSTGRGAGVVGYLDGGSIEDAYNTGAVTGSTANNNFGIAYIGSNGGTATRVYNTYDNLKLLSGSTAANSGFTVNDSTIDTLKHLSKFIHKDDNSDAANKTIKSWSAKADNAENAKATSYISNDGSTNDYTTWRIYEGKSTPLLTAFFKGTSTADYKYNYFANSTDTTATSTGLSMAATSKDSPLSGKNDGADVTVTYNAQYYKIADSTGKGAGAATDISFGGNVTGDDTNLIVNTTGLRDANGGAMQSFISSGQHGYNIVGGNVTINKRKVSASSDPITVTKEYDGTADATAALGTKLSGDNVTFGGLIAGDDVQLANLVATYQDSQTGPDDAKDVGTGKAVVVTTSGTVALTGTSAANYELDTASLRNLNVTGDITPRTLYATLNSTGDFNKTYNGTTYVDTTKNPSATVEKNVKIDDTKGEAYTIVQTTNASGQKVDEDVSIDTTSGAIQYYDADGNTVSDANTTSTPYDIRYTNIKLTGADAKNYQLYVDNGDGTTSLLYNGYQASLNDATNTGIGDGYLKAQGSILRRVIKSSGFSVADANGTTIEATKVYDGTSDYTLPTGAQLVSPASTTDDSSDTGVLSNESITFALSGGTGTFEDKDGNATANVADATQLAAKVTATAGENTKLSNYAWDDVDTVLNNTDTYDVTVPDATITRRTVTLGLGTKKTIADKTYDGNDTVTVANDFSDAQIAYSDGGTNVYVARDAATADGNKNKLIQDDDVSFVITGAYQASGSKAGKDVVLGSDGKAAEKDITYTVKLTGTAANNYALESTADDGSFYQTITGAKGKINQKTLTATVADVSKEYDGVANTGLQDTDKLTRDSFTLTGVVDEDTDAEKNSIISDTVLANLNSHGTTTDHAEYGGVYGTKNADGSFTENANVNRDDDNNVIARDVKYTGLASGNDNYTFDSNVIYGKGTINPFAVDNVTVTTKKTITKVYDAKTGIATTDDGQNTASSASDYIDNLTATTKSGTTIDLNYTIADDDAYYIDTNNAATANVNDVSKARFLFKIMEDGNYTIAEKDASGNALKDTTTGKVTKDLDGASISKRKLLATIVDPSTVTKEYDGYSALEHSDASKVGSNIVKLTDIDKSSNGLVGGETNQSTGAFEDKNVAYDHDKGKYTTKNIYYYVKLDKGQDNYALFDSDGTNQLSFGTKSDNLKGQGTITAKTLGVGFDTVTKTFTNTTSLKDGGIATSKSGTVGDVTGYTGLIEKDEDGNKDSVMAKADLDKSHYDNENYGTNKTVTYSVTFTGDDVGNYRLSDNSAPLVASTAYETTTTGNTIGKKSITSDSDIDVLFGDVTKVYDGTKDVAYDHSDASVYYADEQGMKKASDFVTTSDTNTTGLKLGGISIAKDQYTVADDAAYSTANVGDSTATFHFKLSDSVLKNFDFTGASSDIFSDGAVAKSTKGTITAKKFDFTFTPLEKHTQVYNGSATVVDNSQTTPTASAKDLSGTISNVTGLVNKQDASVLNLAVAGAYDNANAGKGKTITYGVTFNNGNYQFRTKTDSTTTPATVTSYDGTGTLTGDAAKGTMTYTGTGDIEQKTLTVNVGTPLVKDYDGSAKVLDDSLKTVTFDGLVNGETLTPTLNTSTGTDAANGLTGTYVSSRTATAGQDEADVEWDEAANAATWKAVKLSNIDKAFENATGTANKANYKLADDVPGGSITFAKDTQKGKINQLSLDAGDVTKVWTKGYTREYDGTSAIDPQKVVQLQIDTSKIAGKDGKAYTIAYEGRAIFLKNGSATDEQSDAGKNLGIVVDITKVDTTAAGNTNFDLSNLKTFNGKYYNYETEANGGAGVSDGVITPRLLTVTAIKNADFDKTYDGDFYVENPGTKFEIRHLTTDDDGNVTYEKAILDKDASAVEASIGEAYYNSSSTTFAHDKNAAEDKAISVQGTITVKDASSTAANNYTLVLGGKDDPTAVTHTSEVFAKDEDGNLATGTIAKKELHLVDAGNRFDKEFDDSSSVLSDQLQKNFSLNENDLVNGEKLSLGLTKLTGVYVKGEATTEDEQTAEKADAKSNVNWDEATKSVKDWGVLVSGAEDALAGASSTNGALSSNYTIADTVYFQQAAARGQIKQIALTMDNVKTKWTPVEKTYDGTTDIKNVNSLKDPLTLYVDNYTSNKGTSGETTHASTGTPYAYVMYDLNGTPTYDNKNAGKTHSLSNFVVGGLTDVTDDTAGETVNHNFTLSDDLAATYKNKTMTSDANNVINRKLIELGLTDTTKVYDGTKTFKGSYEALNGNDKVTGDDLSVVVTAAYDSANVDAVDGKTKDDGTKYQNITYGVQLSGNDAENYTLVDGAETTSATGLDAEGHITPRPVYVDFKGGVVPTNIDKEYGETMLTTVDATNVNDAKREVLHPENYRPLVVAADKADNSGIVDSDVSLDTDNIKLLYANNGNVARKADGSVTTQTVLFDNVNLKDSTSDASGNAKNYEIVYSNTNHTATDYDNKTVLAGQGTITPKTIVLSYDNATGLAKTYDGTSDASGATYVGLSKTLQQTLEAQEASLLLPTDTLNLTVTGDYTGTAETEANGGTKNGAANIHSNKTEGVDDGKLGVDASVAWTNGNYDVTFDATDASKDFNVDTTATVAPNGGTEPDQFTFTKGVTTTQGTITPKTLTMAGGNASKTYTGTSDIEANLTGEDATGNTNAPITFDGIVDHDKNANSIADLGTAKGTFYYKGTAHTADNEVADANDNETDNDTERDVEWTVTLTNKDYRLADDGTMTGTVTGTGVIKRAELTFASDPVQSRFGQTPTFTGTVTGWANGEGDSFDKTSVTWNTAPGTSVRGTSSAPIYGWYRYDDRTGAGTSWSYDTTKTSNGADIYATDGVDGYRNFGNYGKNYTIVQQPGQFTSQADRPDGLDDVLNPARRVRPDMEVYNHVTHDDVGTVIRDPKAGIEYQAGGTSLSTDGSASYAGTMTVEGAGEVVNLTQSGTTASADRVDLTNDGANYTLSGAENVPTADVTVADVTEDVASATTTASATAAAGTTSATSATNADDTTVTDDDDDAVKAAAESSDEREAEATVEYADQAPSLFSEAITGTNVAS